MWFEWNADKEALNVRKHGFSFDAARRVFEDQFCVIEVDRVDDETAELRWRAIGAVALSGGKSAVLLVVHVYRKNIHGQEITRIISARAADKKDIRRYQEQTAQ
jgi:uncharacterized protein